MNKRRIAAALVSSLMLTAAFAGCGITSGSSQKSEFDPTELVNKVYSAMHSRDYETEFSLRVPPDMQDEFLKEHFRNSELKDSSDLYTAFIDERNRYTTLLDGENEDFTYEILACEELGKLDKVKEILSQNNDKDSDTDIRSSDFDSAKIDDGEPAYLALVKFCLFSPNKKYEFGELSEHIEKILVYRHNGEWYANSIDNLRRLSQWQK